MMYSVSCSVMYDSLWSCLLACQAPLSMGFSRPKYWSGSHPLLPGIFLTQGSNSGLLHCKQILYYLSNHRKSGISFSQFSSVAQLCQTICHPMDCSTPVFPVHHQLRELAQTLVHWVSDAIQLSHPLSSPSPPAFNLSQHQCLFQFFASAGQSIGVSASTSVLPINIQDWFSFRMDWLDLLAIHGTLKSLLQHHSSKPSILQCSAIFIV